MGEANELEHLEHLYEMETFERGGRDLWEHMNDPRDPADVTALVVESCRVKDRLDRLHRISTRDNREWGRLLPTEMEGEFVLKIGDVLREQRQTETVFKQLIAEIARRRSEYDDDGEDEEGGLSDL
ncbi:Uncharacterised protein [Corynebacterium minutissimum]|uniref:Uncharacterized protein n=2 Tax=Corynebacterium minutissimum TaxID=38301 RepID=A0A376CWA2_9CORY|nr:Uncharacterised protein [Corynebacterium minutissimum]